MDLIHEMKDAAGNYAEIVRRSGAPGATGDALVRQADGTYKDQAVAGGAEYVLASAVPASLPNGRRLAGESGVVDLTDAGAGSTLTVGLVDGGVPLAKLAAGTATDGQVATYDSTNGWQPEAGSAVAVTQATDGATVYAAPTGYRYEISDIPSALTEVNPAWRVRRNLRGYQQLRFELRVDVTANVTAEARLMYSTNDGDTWAYFNSDGDDNGPAIPLTVTGDRVSDYVAVDTAAQDDVLFSLFTVHGNGSSDPVISRYGYELSIYAESVGPIENPAPTELDPVPSSANLLIAWEADAPGNTVAGTDEVTTLAGVDGTTTDATGHGTVKAKLIPNAMNGHAVLRFTGTDEYYDFTDVFAGATIAHLFMLIKCAADPAVTLAKSGLLCMSDCSENCHYPGTDGTVAFSFGSASRFTMGDLTPDLSNWHIFEWQADAIGNRCYINGTLVYTDTSFPIDGDWSDGTTPRFGKSLGNFYFNGDLSSFRIWTGAILTGADRTAVLDYLTAKAGL